ncbi:unnamed protein product [Cylindrotheca closterium]|uniref:RING-type domain-containing protein n=1 Tax=Cylindrotheca closterium TaxID=2856 RepID=A0AAD2JLA4_9STRA|nr:unnamed protein product [Cylindrotheca closterium]
MMSEGGVYPWKRQDVDIHRGPPASYAGLQNPLPEPPENMRWIKDEDTREWSLERKLEKDTFFQEITPKPRLENRNYFEHEIQPSDTFTGICLRYKVSAAQLRKANGGFSGTNLFLAPNPLKIPRQEMTKQKSGENEESSKMRASDSSSIGRTSPSQTEISQSVNGVSSQATTILSDDEDDDDDSNAAMQVLQDSLRFESERQNPLQFESARLPPPQPMEERRTSSTTTLYPPIESIEAIARNQIELEETWKAAAEPQKMSYQETKAAAAMKSCCDDCDGSSCTCASSNPHMSPTRHHQFPFMALSNPHAAARATSLRGPTLYPSIFPNGHNTPPRALARRSRGIDYDDMDDHHNRHGQLRDDDDDLLAMKMAAYEGGGGRESMPPVARMPSQQAEATVVDYDVHPADISVHAVQADLVGQEHYHGDSQYNSSQAQVTDYPPTTVTAHASEFIETAQSVIATVAGDATEATVIESGPMDKVTADAWDATTTEALVLEDSNMDIVDLDSKPPAVEDRSLPREQNIAYDAQEGHMQEAAAEATVLEFDDHPSTFPIASNAVHAEFVGQDFRSSSQDICSSAVYEHSSSADSDFPPGSNHEDVAIQSAEVRADEMNNATEATVINSSQLNEAWDVVSAVEETSGTDVVFPSGEAEVVGITEDVHPSELACSVNRAELVGTDLNCAIAVASDHQHEESYDNNFDTQVEEAQVLDDAPGDTTFEPELKDVPMQDNDWTSRDGSGDSFAIAEGAAEVVGITDNYHPSELVGDAAQAELMGTDSNYAVAVASNMQQEGNAAQGLNDATIGDGEFVVEGPVGDVVATETAGQTGAVPRETHATFIDYQEFTQVDAYAAVMAELVGDDNRFSNEEPPMPVTVLSEPVENFDYSDGSALHARKTEVPIANQNSAVIETSAVHQEIALDSDHHYTQGNLSASSHNSPSHVVASPMLTNSAPAAEAIHGSVDADAGVDSIAIASQRTTSSGSIRLQSFHPSSIARNTSNVMARSTSSVIDLLFRCQNVTTNDELARSLYPRELLPSTVLFSEATNSWVTTVNTNQKALEQRDTEESAKSVRAFSVPTRKQAVCLAKAWSPPKMHAFEANPACTICASQFNVFKRASHCRNCGICVCNNCMVQWPQKMLPITYNIKKESMMNVCKTCDWLCSSFRLALLDGDKDRAIAIHSTGNINLTTPFANVKGELFYPVHCAVLGGNLELLKWLIEEHCCPLRSIRISSCRQRDAAGTYTPILTSKGRSLLGIALENRNIDIVHYLVVKKRMMLTAEKGISNEILTQNLDLVLRVLPDNAFHRQQTSLPEDLAIPIDSTIVRSSSGNQGIQTEDDNVITATSLSDVGEEIGTSRDECIICFSNPINCVATPCGHQICCLDCSRNIIRCPVCAVECTFMRVYRP